MFFHEFRHIDAHHRLFGIEQEARQRFAKLCLTDPGRAEEQEGAIGAMGIADPCPRAAHGVGDRLYRFVLTNNALVQRLLHPQ